MHTTLIAADQKNKGNISPTWQEHCRRHLIKYFIIRKTYSSFWLTLFGSREVTTRGRFVGGGGGGGSKRI